MGSKNINSVQCIIHLFLTKVAIYLHTHTHICHVGQTTKWNRIFRNWNFLDY